jgi:hypothetical protein
MSKPIYKRWRTIREYHHYSMHFSVRYMLRWQIRLCAVPDAYRGHFAAILPELDSMKTITGRTS